MKFSLGIHTTKGILDYIHSDLWAPSSGPSHGGAHYMLTFIDDFSSLRLFSASRNGRLWLRSKPRNL